MGLLGTQVSKCFHKYSLGGDTASRAGYTLGFATHFLVYFLFAYLVSFFETQCIGPTLCLKKRQYDVAHYNFNALQPILVICGRDIAERICY